jgi:hypothetical protein
MPYIDQTERKIYDHLIDGILARFENLGAYTPMDVAGAFTYIVYRLLKFFNKRFWSRALGIGCVICAILEIYRRDHTIYENEKIKENGDIE